MIYDIMRNIFSIKRWIFHEFEFSNLKMNWDNPYSIIFEKYNEKDYLALGKALRCIDLKQESFTFVELKNRIEKGDILYVAKENTKIVGFIWVATGFIDVPFFHATIPLKKEEVVFYNSYVLKNYRGRRILNKLKTYVISDLIQKGYEKQLGYIWFKNKSSLKAKKHFKARDIGALTIYTILTLELRFHNIQKYEIILHEGPFRKWKEIFKKNKP